MTTFQHTAYLLLGGVPLWLQMCTATDINLDWLNPGWFIIAMVAGTYTPDIEYIDSYIWEAAKPYSVLIRTKGVDYRKPMLSYLHSIVGLFSSTFIFYLITWAIINEEERTENIGYTTAVFFVFYIIHLFQDFLCMPGVRLFWPLKKQFSLTDIVQVRDREEGDWYKIKGKKKKARPAALFTICLVIVTWAMCYYLAPYTRSSFLNLGILISSAMSPVILLMTNLIAEDTLLLVFRWTLVILFVPILFRTRLSEAIEKAKIKHIKRKYGLGSIKVDVPEEERSDGTSVVLFREKNSNERYTNTKKSP